VAIAHTRSDDTAPWTVDDLFAMPDDGYRYEIFDGSLIVSPPAAMPHASSVTRLGRILHAQLPAELFAAEGVGVYPNERDYYVPDLVVITEKILAGGGSGVGPADVLLAVEVVSPSNPGNDLVLKRAAYARIGIKHYWIVDRRDSVMRVLELDGEVYREAETVRPGSAWSTTRPFPLSLDLGDVF
jgi:Uma2 family endonuclease